MTKGIVKWFNNTKKFGFIIGEDRREIFVHFSEIMTEGYKTLKRGEMVQYEILETPKGAKAVNVVRLNEKSCAGTKSDPSIRHSA